MSDLAVVNASPLIFLARGGAMHLLRLAGADVVVPDVVASEIQARGEDDVTVRALRETPWIRVVPAPVTPPLVVAWDLGPGESAVLAFALEHPGCRAVIDDRAGRRCAEALDIPLRGTVGLVLLAKRRSEIPSARQVLVQLRDAGMYLSDRVLDAALAEVGE